MTVSYDRNVNEAEFDGIVLYRERFGNTYGYDEKGNVKTIQDLTAVSYTHLDVYKRQIMRYQLRG